MTSRERVLTALAHREPDFVPVDLGSTLATSLTRGAYENLRRYLGLPPDVEPRTTNRILGTVQPMEDLLDHYRVDTRCVRLKKPLKSNARNMPDGTFYDDFGIHWRKAGDYYDAIGRPLASATLADLPTAQWIDPRDKGRTAGLGAEAQALYDNTPFCLVADIPSMGLFEGACWLRGFDQFALDLYLDPRFAEALLDKMTDTAIAVWDGLLAEVGPYIQVAATADDVGTQNGPFMNPEMYRKFVKPRHKRLFDFIHSRTTAKVFYHSCGSVYDMIPDFIAEGVDILNPIQRSAAKMDIRRLKSEFGNDICFWGGGIDIQRDLPWLSLERIEEEVRRAMDILAPGGGYVFASTHNIQSDATPDRIDRAFRTALGGRPVTARK